MPGEEAQKVLSLPAVSNTPFRKNFIKTAVCEVRFPILASVRSKTLPSEFFSAVRKEGPIYEQGLVITPGLQEPEPNHSFKSRDRHWTISIRSWAFGLETDNYLSFEDFVIRLDRIAPAIVPLLDTDFFTRIGLRYINSIPSERNDDLSEWINPRISGGLGEAKLGYLSRGWNEYSGSTNIGKYNLRCGYPDEKISNFVLDIDLYTENSDAGSLNTVLSALHEQSFNIFHWCLGEKSLRYLGGD